MLRTLAIFSVFSVLFVQSNSQANKTDDASHTGKPIPQATVKAQPTDGQTFQSGQKNHIDADVRVVSTPPKDFYDKAAFWATLALVVAGFSGIGVGICTLKKLERQNLIATKSAYAAKEAANAALKQADHMITSDRAWLVIKSAMPGYEPRSYGDKFEFWWTVKNTGDTPALNIVTQCRYELVHGRHLTDLAAEPNYPLPIDQSGAPIPPGDSMEFMTFLTWEGGGVVNHLDDTEINTIKLELNHLRVYGYVKYRDVFGNERESRFCEKFVWPLETRRASGFRRLLGIPEAYTRHT
jgi:hypothetical protein